MPSYLGMYIEDNLIKYAKVSKEKDKIKVEAFGVEFFTDISKTIEQIIEDTYSYKTPISINMTQKNYQYINIFSKINKKNKKT